MTGSLDIITLRGLAADGHHGVFDFERQSLQPFSVDLSLWVDTRAAAATDDIDLTVDYAGIAEQAVTVLQGQSVYLLETLAEKVAALAMSHPRVQGVEVTIHKPMAPLRQRFSDVSITIRRGAAEEEAVLPPVAQSSGSVTASAGVAAPAAGTPTPTPTPATAPATPARSTEPPHRRSRAGTAAHSSGLRTEVTAGPPPLQAVLALGGNLEDPPSVLAQAVALLVDADGVDVQDVSPIVRTRPVLEPGQREQPDYWNAVVLVRTGLEPRELLAVTSGIERALGRIRREHWGPRTIDIDVIQVQGVTLDDPALTLPHPLAASRAFVLLPWVLVDPDAVLEGAGRVDALLAAAPDRDGVRDAVSDWLIEPESVLEESDRELGASGTASAPSVQQVEVVTPEPEPEPEPPTVEPSAPRSTRLDLLPDSSRTELRPVGTGGDYLWRRLWAQWEASERTVPDPETTEPPSTGRAAAGLPVEPASRRAAAPRPPVEPPSTSPQQQDSPVDTSAGQHPGPRWAPVRRSESEPEPEPGGRSERAQTGSDAGPRGSAGAQTPESPSLPAWNFPGRDEPRIVDDARDLGSTPRARRSVLDPSLPSQPAPPQDPRPSSGQTTILRRVTVRPTVTGQLPVTRRHREDESR